MGRSILHMWIVTSVQVKHSKTFFKYHNRVINIPSCVCVFVKAYSEALIAILDTTGLLHYWLTVWFCTHNAFYRVLFARFLFSQDSQWWILITFTLFHSFTCFLTVILNVSVSTEKQQLMIHRSKHLPKVFWSSVSEGWLYCGLQKCT